MKLTDDPPVGAGRDEIGDASNLATDASDAEYLLALIQATGIACAAPLGVDPSHLSFSAIARLNPRSLSHEIA